MPILGHHDEYAKKIIIRASREFNTQKNIFFALRASLLHEKNISSRFARVYYTKRFFFALRASVLHETNVSRFRFAFSLSDFVKRFRLAIAWGDFV